MLELNKVSYSYGDQLIFEDSDFFAYEGEMRLIVGKSGIGKTTLLDLLSGLKQFQSGSYQYNGAQLFELNDEKMSRFRSDHIGYIPQDFALIEEYTVMENLLLLLQYCKSLNGKSFLEKVDDLLVKFNVQHLKEKKVRTLSGGQKQRVAIIRGIVGAPSILLADELTTNLDEENFYLVQEALLEQKESGAIVIIASHDSRLQLVADKIYRIESRKLVLE